jgi:hypothetical protein
MYFGSSFSSSLFLFLSPRLPKYAHKVYPKIGVGVCVRAREKTRRRLGQMLLEGLNFGLAGFHYPNAYRGPSSLVGSACP